MHWFGDFDSHGKHTAAPFLTITSVSVCVGVFLFLCLVTPSVSHALCPNETDVDSPVSTLLYSNVEFNKKFTTDGEPNTPAEWNVLGARHLYNWKVKGLDEDIKEARKHFKTAADHEYPPALNNLGIIHLNGWGADENIEKAKDLFDRASKGGHTPALNNLGVIELREALRNPNTLDTLDLSKSDEVERIRQAANEVYPPALNNLGILHLRKQNYAEAINYLERAAKLNYAPALFNLGALYARGSDGQRDYGKAVDVYGKAARIEKGPVNSFIWLGIAKKHGFAEAAEIQSVVEKLLTEQQVSEATSCVEKISPKIHAMDPFTLYDDVAVAPELYELPNSWEQSWVSRQSWGSINYKGAQE